MQIRIMRTHVFNIRNMLSFYSLRENNAYLRLNMIMVFNILHGENQCACVGVERQQCGVEAFHHTYNA